MKKIILILVVWLCAIPCSAHKEWVHQYIVKEAYRFLVREVGVQAKLIDFDNEYCQNPVSDFNSSLFASKRSVVDDDAHTDSVSKESEKLAALIDPFIYLGLGDNTGLRTGIGVEFIGFRFAVAVGIGLTTVLGPFYGSDTDITYSSFIESPQILQSKMGFGVAYTQIHTPKFGNNREHYLALYSYYVLPLKKYLDCSLSLGYNQFISSIPYKPLISRAFIDIKILFALLGKNI